MVRNVTLCTARSVRVVHQRKKGCAMLAIKILDLLTVDLVVVYPILTVLAIGLFVLLLVALRLKRGKP